MSSLVPLPRHLFTLAAAAVVSAVLAASPEDAVFAPGQPIYDVKGDRVYAGGANLYLENGLYYMIGEGKKTGSGDLSTCLNLYSSPDLTTWTLLSCAVPNSAVVAPFSPGAGGLYRMERPKLFKCPGGQPGSDYRIVFHCDTDSFAHPSIGILAAGSPTGPFSFVRPCFAPDGLASYDMGTFVDAASAGGDGRAYLIRSVQNQYAGISAFDSNCTDTTGIVSRTPIAMEGQALMRGPSGELHAAGSHLTGWNPNAAQFWTTTSATLAGAVWTNDYNPSGDATTFDSQSTFIYPYVHPDGHTTYIWLSDRWNANGKGGIDNMTMVWLPLEPPSGGNSQWSLKWHDTWALKDF